MHYKSVVLSERRSIPGDGHVGQLTPAGSASGRPSEGYGPPPPESFPYQRRRRGDPVRARAGWRQSLYGAGRKRPRGPGRGGGGAKKFVGGGEKTPRRPGAEGMGGRGEAASLYNWKALIKIMAASNNIALARSSHASQHRMSYCLPNSRPPRAAPAAAAESAVCPAP